MHNEIMIPMLDISPLFFLSTQTTTLVTLFIVTVKSRELKLSTHLDSGWMYNVYQNKHAATYTLFYLFSFLSLRIFAH